ncbi:hypothetical protein Tco_0145474 [Tanacetum coccineum]
MRSGLQFFRAQYARCSIQMIRDVLFSPFSFFPDELPSWTPLAIEIEFALIFPCLEPISKASGEKFVWTDERQESFEEIERRLFDATWKVITNAFQEQLKPYGSKIIQPMIMSKPMPLFLSIEESGDTILYGKLVSGVIWASMEEKKSNLMHRSNKPQSDDVSCGQLCRMLTTGTSRECYEKLIVLPFTIHQFQQPRSTEIETVHLVDCMKQDVAKTFCIQMYDLSASKLNNRRASWFVTAGGDSLWKMG